MRYAHQKSQCTVSLTIRGKTFWCDIVMHGNRIRRSLGTSDQDEAERLYAEIRKKIVPIGREKPRLQRPDIAHRLARVRARAVRRGLPCDLDLSYMKTLWNEQGGRCALTGIVFDLERGKGIDKAPFGPSVDRINPELGYVRGNVRWVCLSINIGINEWGEAVFKRTALAYLGHSAE